MLCRSGPRHATLGTPLATSSVVAGRGREGGSGTRSLQAGGGRGAPRWSPATPEQRTRAAWSRYPSHGPSPPPPDDVARGIAKGGATDAPAGSRILIEARRRASASQVA